MSMYIFLMLSGFLFFFLLIFFMPYLIFCLSMVEWIFMSLKFSVYYNSVMFSFILLVVTASVLAFSSYYLDGELNFNYYYFVLLVFVGSMFSLTYSNSSFTMLLSWDLLGISSFFLVLFYNNWDSCSGAMNTVLTNRLGDFFIFVFFSGVVFSGYCFLNLSMFCFLSCLMLLLAAFTKSAQFPFSSWLPKAMSAPTPVSSLVHSSTLVTAGLILIMNFSELVMFSQSLGVMMFVGIFTMFFSSVAALVEEDLKKVVALSTLSQMGFSLLTIGLGLNFVSFVHLVSHALFKSCLFMQVGFLIHCSLGQQDGRGYNNMGSIPDLIQLQLAVTLFCLCGLIFSSGAVSKDYILEFFFSNFYSVFFVLMFFVSIFLTFGYSYRLWKGFYLCKHGPMSYLLSSNLMNVLSLFLVLFSVGFLWWLNMNMLSIPSLFLYVDFFVPLFYIFIMLVFLSWGLKLVLKELGSKFIVDYLAKLSIYGVRNFKFLDNFLGGLNLAGVSFFSLNSFLSNFMLKNGNFNCLLWFWLVVFSMSWDFSLF